MNIRFLNTNKKTKYLAAMLILGSTALDDLTFIFMSSIRQLQGDHYRELQKNHLRENISSTIDYIENLMVVTSMDRRESFSKFYNTDLTSPYQLDSVLRANADPEYWKDELDHYTELKWKIVRSKSNSMTLYYQDALHLELLYEYLHLINAYDNGTCLDKFISLEYPQSSNTIYFASTGGCNSRSRDILRINDFETENLYYDFPYEVRKSDTLHISYTVISMNHNELDTVTVYDCLVKRNHNWKSIMNAN